MVLYTSAEDSPFWAAFNHFLASRTWELVSDSLERPVLYESQVIRSKLTDSRVAHKARFWRSCTPSVRGVRPSRAYQSRPRTCPPRHPHIKRRQVFNQSQSQILQAIPMIPDYQLQVKNNFSKPPLPWSHIPVTAKTALLIIPENSSSIRASRTLGPRRLWSRDRLRRRCDATSTSRAL